MTESFNFKRAPRAASGSRIGNQDCSALIHSIKRRGKLDAVESSSSIYNEKRGPGEPDFAEIRPTTGGYFRQTLCAAMLRCRMRLDLYQSKTVKNIYE
jgi:hypothetical protein